jgi:hypothetical protein
MPPQRGYGGRLLLQRQLPHPPKSFFDCHAQGPANFGLSPETEFFNGIRQFQTSKHRTVFRNEWAGSSLPGRLEVHHAPDLIATSVVSMLAAAATPPGGVGHDLILFDAFWHFLPGLPNHLQPGRAGLGCSKGGRTNGANVNAPRSKRGTVRLFGAKLPEAEVS